MAWNGQPPHHTQMPFWDFMQQLDPNHAGAGVDHAGPPGPPGGFPFGGGEGGGFFHPWAARGRWGGGWGGRGGWGRHWGGGRHGHGHGGWRGRRGTDGEDEFPPTDGEQDVAGEDVPMLSETEKDNNEKAGSPETVRETPADGEHPDPPESVPHPGPGPHHRHGHGCGPGFRGRGRCGGRGGPGLRARHEHPRHHHHHGPGHHEHHLPPPPPYGAHGGPGFPWNFGPMMAAFAQHPIAQGLRDYMNRAAGPDNNATRNGGDDNNNDVETFMPPVDIFRIAGGWVLHIALPGARKEDVGVSWDADRSVLSVSGVVHRPGDEQFLQGLVSSERRAGLFQRDVRLPPPGSEEASNGRERDEVDAEGIAARMEDGVLIVNVPLIEREWTEVRKVDIE